MFKMHKELREASIYSSTSQKDVVIFNWLQRLHKASVLVEDSDLLLCTDWSRFHCAREFLLCSSVDDAIANRRVKIWKYLSNICKNTTAKQSNVFGERSHGVEEQSQPPGVCLCLMGGWWSHQPLACLKGKPFPLSPQDIADPFFAYCKQHADRFDRKWKRKNYLALQSYCKVSLQERERQLPPEAQVRFQRSFSPHRGPTCFPSVILVYFSENIRIEVEISAYTFVV